MKWRQERPERAPRVGFTLMDLVVVIAIIAVLIALIVPAVQKVRESASRARCLDQLRQIGMAFHHHHGAVGVFPSNGGWDGKQQIPTVTGVPTVVTTFDWSVGITYTWGVGDPTLSARNQTGSWAYAILPFLEQEASFRSRSWTVPLGFFLCPSRRFPEAQIPRDDEYGRYNGGGWPWGKTDYAANGWVVPNRPTCLRFADIPDGTSSTVLCGEKSMKPKDYQTGTWYWDEPFFVGGSGGTNRYGKKLQRDANDLRLTFADNWGAAHSSGANFLFADGSARLVSYSTSEAILSAILSPAGREVVPDF